MPPSVSWKPLLSLTAVTGWNFIPCLIIHRPSVTVYTLEGLVFSVDIRNVMHFTTSQYFTWWSKAKVLVAQLCTTLWIPWSPRDSQESSPTRHFKGSLSSSQNPFFGVINGHHIVKSSIVSPHLFGWSVDYSFLHDKLSWLSKHWTLTGCSFSFFFSFIIS